MAWAIVGDEWWSHPKVMGLSLSARGLWITALSWSCHQKRDHVPTSFISMVGASDRETSELSESKLWDEVEDGWLIHDWADYNDRSLREKREEAGRKGGLASGKARQAKVEGDPRPDVEGSPDRSNVEANVEAGSLPCPALPIPTQPLEKKPLSESDIDFEQFWRTYPRREGKKAARAKFDQAIASGVSLDTILTAAAAYRDLPGREPRFTKHASTWLNQGCWDDELVPRRTGTVVDQNRENIRSALVAPPVPYRERMAAASAAAAALDPPQEPHQLGEGP